jgi:hypothetical protein
MIHSIRSIYSPGTMSSKDGRHYTMAVCEPWRNRLADAWAILTGRAYAFQWPEPGDLEKAIGMKPLDRRRPTPPDLLDTGREG